METTTAAAKSSGFNIIDVFIDLSLLGSEWVLWLLIVLSVVSVAINRKNFKPFFLIGIKN